MDRHFVPRYSDSKGNDFCHTPLSSSPFRFVPRCALPPRFVSPPAPLDASPLCRPSPPESLRYRSPIHSPNVPLSPYGSRGTPFGVPGPNVSYGAPLSGSSYGDPCSAGNFRQVGYRSWNGTPNNGHEVRRGVKRNTPSFRQVN